MRLLHSASSISGSSLVERVKSWSNNDVGQLRTENEKQEGLLPGDRFVLRGRAYDQFFVDIYPVDQVNANAKCIDRQ